METVVRLASSVLNKTSSEFKERLQVSFKKFRTVINKADLGNVAEERRRIEELETLDEGEIEEI